MKITKIQTGNTVKATVQQQVIVKKGYSPFVQDGTWWQYDETVKGYVDTGITAEGKDGQDGRDFRYEDFTAEQLAALKGEKGDPGKDGKDGEPGKNGKDGVDGKNGTDGRDGKTPVKGIDYFDGEPGQPGKDGAPGKDGSPGRDGTDGKTPVKGVDYFTDSEVSQIEKNAADLVKVPTRVSELENDSEYKSQKPIMSKTWENIWNTAPNAASSSNQKYCGWYFFRVKPVDRNKQFSIKFRGTLWMPNWTQEKIKEQGLNPSSYGNGGENNFFGRQETTLELTFTPEANTSYTTYVMDNYIAKTNYRSAYYVPVAFPKTKTQEDFSWYLGLSIWSAYQCYAVNASIFEKFKEIFGRTIVIDILEYDNCTVEFLDELIDYDLKNFSGHSFTLIANASVGRFQTGPVDNDHYDRHTTNFYKTCDGIVTGFALLMHTDGIGKIGQVLANTATNSTQTKQFSGRRFNIWKGIYHMGANVVKADNDGFSGGSLYDSIASIDIRYASNCGNNILSNVAGTDVYMVGSFDEEGYFVPAQLERTVGSNTYYDYLCDETMLPTSEDGYVYVLLGHTTSTSRYTINLLPKHPIFRHNGKYMECVGVV